MLDYTGKMYERMILNRVQSELDDPENEGLSDMQYGFRAGRITLHAVQEVQKRVDKAFSMERKYFYTVRLSGVPKRMTKQS